MKKNILLVFGMVVAMGLVGCNAKDSAKNPENPTSAGEEETTVTEVETPTQEITTSKADVERNDATSETVESRLSVVKPVDYYLVTFRDNVENEPGEHFYTYNENKLASEKWVKPDGTVTEITFDEIGFELTKKVTAVDGTVLEWTEKTDVASLENPDVPEGTDVVYTHYANADGEKTVLFERFCNFDKNYTSFRYFTDDDGIYDVAVVDASHLDGAGDLQYRINRGSYDEWYTYKFYNSGALSEMRYETVGHESGDPDKVTVYTFPVGAGIIKIKDNTGEGVEMLKERVFHRKAETFLSKDEAASPSEHVKYIVNPFYENIGNGC